MTAADFVGKEAVRHGGCRRSKQADFRRHGRRYLTMPRKRDLYVGLPASMLAECAAHISGVTMNVITRFVGSALLGVLGSTLCAQAQTPPAQPSYPASEQTRAAPNRTRSADRVIEAETTDVEPRCDKLSGLERAECERRDVTNDDAPAGVTTSMHEKEKRIQNDERMRAEQEAAAVATSEAEADSDTAGAKPAQSTSRVRQAARDRTNPDEGDSADEAQSADERNEDANRREQQMESNSEADTLGPPD